MSLILTVMTGLVESQPTLDSESVLVHMFICPTVLNLMDATQTVYWQ